MLILTRRADESLFIGDEVSVTVLSVKGNQVRLGVEAPRDIAVYREEVLNRGVVAVPEDEPEAALGSDTTEPSNE